jgi:hypothetical protein
MVWVAAESAFMTKVWRVCVSVVAEAGWLAVAEAGCAVAWESAAC